MNINVFHGERNAGYDNICSSTCYRLSVIPNLILGKKLRYSGPGTSEQFFYTGRANSGDQKSSSYRKRVMLKTYTAKGNAAFRRYSN